MSEITSATIPPGLLVNSEQSVQRKMNDFQGLGAAGLRVVFDFDRTLTTRRPGADDEITTWHILNEFLPTDTRARIDQRYEKYRALELAETMTKDDAIEWWTGDLLDYVQSGVQLSLVEENFLEIATMRQGTKEVFEYCHAHNIPTIILSAGVRNIIDAWSRAYELSPTLTLSTALVLDERGRAVDWERDTLIHTLNKDEVDHPELKQIVSARPNALVIGDSMGDADMARGEDNVIRIRVNDPSAAALDVSQIRKRSFERFDAIIESGDLLPLLDLIKAVT